MLHLLRTRLHRCAEAVAAALLALIFVAFLLQIALRYVFNWPVGWTAEISVAGYLWLVLWGSAFVMREPDEIRIELLPSLLGPRGRRIAAAIGAIAVVLLFGLSLPATYDYVSFMKVEKTSYLKIPFHWLYSIYLVFAVMVIVRQLLQLVEAVTGRRLAPPGPGRT